MQENSEIQIEDRHVNKFLKKIDKKHLLKIYTMFESVETYGIEQHLKTRDIKKIKGIKEDVFELKVKTGLEYRFMGAIEHNIFRIVHGFIKKTQKDIKREIDLAIQRIKNLN